jgi:phage anti-repressor protein
MNNQLVPVFNGNVNNESILLCNARTLHEFLGVGKRFASWITERINEYGFIENQDYVIISQNREIIKRGRPATDYHLTLDTAKELAMVERNDRGRQVRRYFIECEKKLNGNSRKTTTDERTPLRDAINMLVGKKGIMYPEAYSFIHQRFNVSHIDELKADQLPMAVEYVHRLVLEGEFLGKQEALPATRLSLSYGMDWLEQYRWLIGDAAKGKVWNYPAKLLTANSDNPNPIGSMLVELKDSGYVVDAAMFQLQAMQHHIDVFRRKISTAISTLQ